MQVQSIQKKHHLRDGIGRGHHYFLFSISVLVLLLLLLLLSFFLSPNSTDRLWREMRRWPVILATLDSWRNARAGTGQSTNRRPWSGSSFHQSDSSFRSSLHKHPNEFRHPNRLDTWVVFFSVSFLFLFFFCFCGAPLIVKDVDRETR